VLKSALEIISAKTCDTDRQERTDITVVYE